MRLTLLKTKIEIQGVFVSRDNNPTTKTYNTIDQKMFTEVMLLWTEINLAWWPHRKLMQHLNTIVGSICQKPNSPS